MTKLQITNYKLQILLIVFSLTYSLFPIPYNPLLITTALCAETADEVVNRIQSEFESIKDLTGRFTQKSYIRDLEETHEFKGIFHLKKPARIMWEYTEPRDEKVVIRDRETLIHKRSENQVIKTTFSEESYSQVPIAMLESFENIKNDFNISMPEENALQLIPEKKMGHIKSVIMETSVKGFPIRMFTILDTYGNIIMIELTDIKTNPGLDDSLFILQIPDDAEVFDMSQ
ncbi:MAG: outer membrane lipoprotein carrier protein LolA [Nitrospiraceae bacterium]|nr:MAG: outer membrane lipoprotein carrier protein LolA [Nitrospiraceae bacterium]